MERDTSFTIVSRLFANKTDFFMHNKYSLTSVMFLAFTRLRRALQFEQQN